jgi:hypothetical protein
MGYGRAGQDGRVVGGETLVRVLTMLRWIFAD